MLFTRLRRSLFSPLAGKSRSDRTLLVICMCLAFFFWLLVKLSREYQTSRAVAFSFDMPPGQTFIEDPPKDMEVSIKGTGWALLGELLSSRTVELNYNLLDAEQLNLSTQQLRRDIAARFASSEVEIVSLNYDNLNLLLVSKAQKKVPIRARYSLDFADGYQLSAPMAMSLDSVTVAGPTSLLQEIEVWETDSIELRRIDESKEVKVPLTPAPDELSLDPSYVTLTIKVEQFTELSFFIPVTVKNPPKDSLRIFPDKVKLDATVGLSHYNSVTPDDFSVVANLDNVVLAEGKNSVPIQLVQQSPYTRNVRLQRRSVEFYIVKQVEKED